MTLGLPQVHGPDTVVSGLRNFDTGPGSQRLPPAKLERELFPVPLVCEAATTGFSRGSRKRIELRNLATKVRNEAARCLNWLHGFNSSSSVPLLAAGESVAGHQAAEMGLVDLVASGGDVLPGAVAFARGLRSRGDRLRRATDLPVEFGDAPEWFAEQRARQLPRDVQGPAAETILNCIEAGVTQSVEEATRIAAEGTRMLSSSREFRALRHLFFAERQAGRVAEVTPQDRRRIQTVTLVGPGLDDWRSLLIKAGVAWSDDNPDLVLVSTLDEATLATCRALAPGSPRAIPVASTGDHEQWLGLRAALSGHPLLGLCLTGERLVQLVHEPDVQATLLDAAAALVRRLGKVCVACRPTPGFIVERLSAAAARGGGASTVDGRRAMASEARELLAQGVAARTADIDVAMVAGGGFPGILGGPLFHEDHAAA